MMTLQSIKLMTPEEETIARMRSLMAKVLFSSDRPSKAELIRSITIMLAEKLRRLSYEEVEQFAKEFKLLEES